MIIELSRALSHWDVSFFIMDRSYEELRSEVLELDRESQEHLVEEIEHQWSATIDEAVYAEAHRRIEAHRRGEGSSMSAEESFVRGRLLIEEAKR